MTDATGVVTGVATGPSTGSGAPRAAAGPARVALVHDWLTGMRGGEKVLEQLIHLFPSADLFTLVHVAGSVSRVIEARPITTSVLSRLPLVGRHYRLLLPLFPWAVEQFDLDGYDLVISSSHCAVKSVVGTGRARHLCYCHTPMRYAWDQFEAYFGPARVGRRRHALVAPIIARLARWDRATATRPDRYVANSQYVARRIGRYYNRRAHVVHPPVDTTFFHPAGPGPGEGALVVSALVPYKRIDLAIAACRLAGVGLRVVGSGPDLSRLRREGPGVDFLGDLSDEAVREEYRRARMVLLPGVEDFGIVPVEAQACGRPVVALGVGGATETVRDGETGILFGDATAAALAEAIERAASTRFDADRIRAHAETFGQERFRERMRAAVESMLAAPESDLRC